MSMQKRMKRTSVALTAAPASAHTVWQHTVYTGSCRCGGTSTTMSFGWRTLRSLLIAPAFRYIIYAQCMCTCKSDNCCLRFNMQEDLQLCIKIVQSYTINSSKVVFLKKRPQNRQFKGSGNICTSCDRSLQEPYFHCSLDCKVINSNE